MATTRIMPLHIGKGRTESRAISDIIDYVANPQKTDNGKLITGYGCDSWTADAEFLLAKRQYIAATGRVRGADDVIASIINGEDGSTSVFIFGEAQKQSLKIRIRNAIYQSRRKRIEKRIAANPHTLAEVVQYAKDHYDLVEINPAATNWIERQKNLKASLIMQHKPELLGQRKDIPKPDFHNEESVKNFLNEMEIRNKLIDQMPDNVIPMDFHLYEIKIGEDLMEIEVDYTWNIFGISYSGNKSVIKRFKKIARDLYCYYGVSEEDIKNRTKRYSSLVTELSS